MKTTVGILPVGTWIVGQLSYTIFHLVLAGVYNFFLFFVCSFHNGMLVPMAGLLGSFIKTIVI